MILLFSSLAETVEREAEDNVMMIQESYDTNRSVREAIGERFAD